MKYHVGCSGYYYSEWKGIFYPMDLPKKNWLAFYAQHFNTVEINASFYRNPSEKTLLNWYAQTPADFLFSLKAPKLVTHLKKFASVKEELQVFYKSIGNTLSEKLACILFQLPPSFTYSLANLRNILAALDPGYVNVVEFRDAGWWRQDVFDSFSEQKIIFCSESYPGGIPEDVVPNPELIYYRFHGKPVLYKSLYSADALTTIAQAMKHADRECFVYFNNTWGNAALDNAETMKLLLE